MTKKIQTSEQVDKEKSYKTEKETTTVQMSEQAVKERSYKMKKENSNETITEIIEKVTGEVENTNFSATDYRNYDKFCNAINKDLTKIEGAFLSIATNLYNIYTKELYKIENYENIYDMASEKFGLSRGSCNNYINICKKFGAIDDTSKKCTGLLPEYKEYSPSKLAVMRSMPKALLSEVKPDMSVRQIIDLKANKPKTEEAKGTKTEKANKQEKQELLKISDINEIFDTEKDNLLDQIKKFKQEHPDTEYKISITLTY